MSWIIVGVAAVSVVSSIAGSDQAQAQAKQGEQTDNDNASQAIANMQAVEAQSSAQEEAQRVQGDQYLGRQRAAMGDSGTGSLGSGSNFLVGQQSAVSAEMDALNVRYGGELKGSEYLQSANNFKAGADAAGAQASEIAATKYTSAALAGLTSAAKTYSGGARLKTAPSSPGAFQ